MLDIKAVESIVKEFAEPRGIEIVRLSVSPDDSVVLDVDSLTGVDLDTCAELSKWIEQHLDRDVEDYDLMVGTASLTDPLVLPMQYQKHIGHQMSVITKDGTKLKGLLVDADDQGFMIDVEQMVRKEGAKRRTKEIVSMRFGFAEVKSVTYMLKV